MKLGMLRRSGPARRGAMSTLAMVVGAVGLSGVQAHDSGAAVVAPTPDPTAPVISEPPSTTTTLAPTTTTTAAPTTTTTVPPPPTTTTTVPPPTPTTTTAPPPPPRAPAAEPSRQAQIEAIADESAWNWRGAGVRLVVGFFPGDCCHWGVYESPARTLWIGPTAFATPSRLRYVVLHELAHAWQYTSGHIYELIDDYEPWGRSTPADALEAGGDCIATLWGARDHHYWSCPAGALHLAARRLAGDWA